MGRESLRWRALDACVAALALPSLLLLLVMLTSDQETPRSPVERVQTLALASLLLLVSVFVCCYVAQRLRLVASCPILSFAGYKHEPASEPLAPWQHKTLNTTSITQQSPCVPPPSYDTFIEMELTQIMTPTQVIIPGVHSNKSWAQRASMEQGCYQNLRPQEDNG